MRTPHQLMTHRARVVAALAALALFVCASPTLAQAPAAELPTYKIGDKWIRNDGTWELTRIERGDYVFSAGPGREIHFTKTLAVTKVILDGNVRLELSTPRMEWPLRVGRFGTNIVNATGPTWVFSNISHPYVWSIASFEEVKVPAGTFQAFKIVSNLARGFTNWALWYAPEVQRYVKGESPVPGLAFELGAPTAPAIAAAAPPATVLATSAPPSEPVERPTYRIGDRWIRSDGTYELKQIDKDVYVFEAGRGNEIRLTKGLEIQTVVRDGRVEFELDPGVHLSWPLLPGRAQTYRTAVWRGPGGRGFSGPSNPEVTRTVEPRSEVSTPAGKFHAYRIAYSLAFGETRSRTTRFALWYAPDIQRLVKGESGDFPALNFELTGLGDSMPPRIAQAPPPAPVSPVAGAVPVDRPTYRVGDKWIRSDGAYELKRIDKDVYVFEASKGNEIRLTNNLEIQTVMRDGRVEFDLDSGLRLKWPLESGQISPYLSVWRGTGLQTPEGNIGSDIRLSARIEAESRVSVPAGTFRAYRIVYTGAGGPQYAAVLSDFISLWYSPEARRFVKGESSRIATMNFELTGLDDRAPPVVAAAPPLASPSAPRQAPAQPAPAPPPVVVPPIAPTSPPVAAAPPPPVVSLELEGPPGAQVRIGGSLHALDAQGRLTLALLPGQHQIDATKEGFVPARQTVTLAPGQAKVTQRLALAQVVPPTITVLDPKAGTPVRTPDVRLRVEVKSSYRVSALRVGKEGDSAQQTFAPSAGVKAGESWIVETLVSLVEGENRVRLEAADEHGGKTEQRMTIVRQSIVATPAPAPVAPPAPASDNEAPKIALNYPPEGAKVDREQIVVLGLVTDNVAVDRVLVSVNGRMVAMTGDAAVSARSHPVRMPVTLQPGDNAIEVTAVDKAGNASQVVRTVARAAPAVAAPAAPPLLKHEQWAVVIGVGNYESPSVPRLKYTVADADAIYKTVIGSMGFKKENVLLLTDRSERKPTLKNIKWALGTFLSRAAKKDDTVLIFFAGHGAPEVDARGLERDGLAKYLIPQDADPDDLFSTALPMDDLHTIFGRIESERIVVFLDACYSGATGGRTFTSKRTRASASGLDDQFLERLTRSKGRAIVTASRATEVSIELPDLGHGVFTYYLVEGLKGAADLNHDGIVTLQELYEYLEQQVTRKARSAGGNQHPVMKGEMEGSLPLAKVRQK